MKKTIIASFFAAVILLCAALVGCSISGDSSEPLSSDSSDRTTSDYTSESSTVTDKPPDTTAVTTDSQTTQESKPPVSSTEAPQTTTTGTKPPDTTPVQTDPPDTTPSQTEPPDTTPSQTEPPQTDPPQTTPPQTEAPVTQPSEPFIITPTADGVTVYGNDRAVIDASNASQGYIMVKLKSAEDGSFRILVNADDISVRYTFQLNNSGRYEIIPLTEGSGSYTVTVLKVTSAGKGTSIFKQSLSVNIADSFRPFLSPNQFCMYSASSNCVALASKLCGGKDEIGKTAAIYDYVINNIRYVSTAENSANGYIPNPDSILASAGGICFDYASLMAAMLRSQKIPTRVVVGYAGDTYHAWISVYITGSGWIDGYIYFDGNKWNRMDPTFAASATDEADYKKMVDYISNSGNYSVLYYY